MPAIGVPLVIGMFAVRVGRRIERRRLQEGREIDCVDIGVIGVGRPPVAGPLGAELRALAQGRSDIGEIAKAVGGALQRQDVVGERGAEEPRRPLQLAPLRTQTQLAESVLPAEAQFESLTDHLLEFRVRTQKIVDDAGVVGVGAAELERRRRAIGHRVARIEVDVGRDLVGEADRRIEVEEARVAVEKSAVRAVETDPGVIEARAGGHRQAVGRAERIERVEPGIGVVRMDRDRVQKAVRLVDGEREADHRERVVVEAGTMPSWLLPVKRVQP